MSGDIVAVDDNSADMMNLNTNAAAHHAQQNNMNTAAHNFINSVGNGKTYN
jgi:hypothetical protein